MRVGLFFIFCLAYCVSWSQMSRSEKALLSQYLLTVPEYRDVSHWLNDMTADSRIIKDSTTKWQGPGRLILFGYIPTSQLPLLNADTIRIQVSEQQAARQVTVNGLDKKIDSVRYYQYVTTYIFNAAKFDSSQWAAFINTHLKNLTQKFERLKITVTPQQSNFSTAMFGNGGLQPLFNVVWWQDKKWRQYKLSISMTVYDHR